MIVTLNTLKEKWDSKFDAALKDIGYWDGEWHEDPNEEGTSDGFLLKTLAGVLKRVLEKGDDAEAYALYSAMYDILDNRESPMLYCLHSDGTSELVNEKLEWREDEPEVVVSGLRTLLQHFDKDVPDDVTMQSLVNRLCDEIEERWMNMTEGELEAAREVGRGMDMIRQAVMKWDGIHELMKEQHNEQDKKE